MDVTFLVGAGVSVAVGMPCTRQITEAVLTSADFVCHTDGRVIFDADKTLPAGGVWNQRDEARGHVLPWQRLLQSIYEHMKVLVPGREPTYEDLYYVVEALWGDLGSTERDPLVEAFWYSLEPTLPCDQRDQLARWRNTGVSDSPLTPETYIRGAVGAYLAYHESRVQHLSGPNFFAGATTDSSVERRWIFTLNHDRLLERWLGDQVFAGLGPLVGDMRLIKPDTYRSNRAAGTVLVKLHGSLDWYCYRHQQTGQYRHGVSVRCAGHDSSDRQWRAVDPQPRLLVGTANKARRYLDNPFPELLCLFYSHLQRTKVLVVCGHSFGDEGIRAHLQNWVISGAAQRLCIIDPNAAELKRLWLLRSVPQHGDRILAIDHGIQDVFWQEVKAWLTA